MILQTFVFPHFDLPVLVCFTDVSTLTPILIGLEIFILSVLVLFSSKEKIAKEVLDATTKFVAIVAGSTMAYKNTRVSSGGSSNSYNGNDNDKDKDKKTKIKKTIKMIIK